jgi:hypothetical protein
MIYLAVGPNHASMFVITRRDTSIAVTRKPPILTDWLAR